VAWSKERKANEDKWLDITVEQREAITRQLKQYNRLPTIYFHANDTVDCKTLVADLRWAVTNAGWDAFPLLQYNQWLGSGITIQVSAIDIRSKALQSALRDVLKVEAEIQPGDDSYVRVLIGSKRRAS
jgi:hypothetical protein